MDKKKLLFNFLSSKLKNNKFDIKKVRKNINLISNGYIDSMDAVEIIVKIEKLKKKKVDTAKIFGKKFDFSIHNLNKIF